MKCYHCNDFGAYPVTLSKRFYCRSCVEELNAWRALLMKDPYVIVDRPTQAGDTDNEDSDYSDEE